VKIYIQDLEKYNQGCSVCGEWIDLQEITEEELEAKLKKLIKDEYIILDWEYNEGESIFFSDIEGEYANPYELLNRQETIDELSEEDRDKLAFLMEFGNFNFNEAIDRLDEVSFMYGDMQEVAEEFMREQLGDAFDRIYPYIDWKKYIRDMEIEGYVEYNDKVFFPY